MRTPCGRHGRLHIRAAVSRLALGLALAGVMLTLLPGSAAAAHRTSTDPVGDAARPVDVSKVRVVNGPKRVITRIHFHSLDRSRLKDAFVHLDTGKRFGKGYYVGLSRRRGVGPFRTRFYRVTEFTSHYVGTEPRRCRGVRFGFGKDQLHITFPQRCRAADRGFRYRVVTNPGRVKRGEYDHAPNYFSRWVERG